MKRFILSTTILSIILFPINVQGAEKLILSQKLPQGQDAQKVVAEFHKQLLQKTTFIKESGINNVRSNLNTLWMSKEKYNIVVKNSVGFTASLSSGTDLEASTVLSNDIKKTTQDFFTKKGFMTDEANTLIQENGYTQGFKKNNLYCVSAFGSNVVETLPNDSSNWQLSCFLKNSYLEAYYSQAPLIRALLPKVTDPDIYVFNVTAKIANFVNVDIGVPEGPGAWAILKKISKNKWITVEIGNGGPTCSLMKKYGVPKSVYIGCD